MDISGVLRVSVAETKESESDTASNGSTPPAKKTKSKPKAKVNLSFFCLCFDNRICG